MKLFDTHIHFFPDSIAAKAMSQLSETTEIAPCTDGTLSGSLTALRKNNICGGIALHIATNPHQQSSVNSFAAASQSETNLLCFGSVHPDAEDALSELSRIAELNLSGIKLHPDYQGFFAEDPRIFPIYEKIQELGLPLVFHAGFDPVSPKSVHCSPQGLAQVADMFPRLKIIAAHMGGAYMPEDAVKHLSDKANIHFDTAVISEFLNSASFGKMVSALGAERIFFATDMPWAKAADIIEIIENSDLSAADKELIYHKNAEDYFKLNSI